MMFIACDSLYVRLACRLYGRIVTLFCQRISRRRTRRQSVKKTLNLISTNKHRALNIYSVSHSLLLMPTLYRLFPSGMHFPLLSGKEVHIQAYAVVYKLAHQIA